MFDKKILRLKKFKKKIPITFIYTNKSKIQFLLF